MEMQALVEEVAGLVAKIKAGTASLGEIEAFAAATAQLHERAIVLRYKAYEVKVFGEPEQEVKSTDLPKEAPVELPVKNEVPMEEPNLEETEEEAFDLFGFDDSEEIEEAKPEEVAEVEPAQQEEIVSVKVETPREEEKVEAQKPIETPTKPTTTNLHPIYTKLNVSDDSLAARLMAVKLETLSGAFGLNERLQIIQELFNGSSEELTIITQKLDTIKDKSEARLLVSGYANQYSWDLESVLALEFIQKIERLYA